MVAGHQLAYRAGLGEKPEGSLAEQLMHAEVVNLQLAGGMQLGHHLSGGRLLALEKGLDLSFQARERSLFPPLSTSPLALASSGRMGSIPAQEKQGPEKPAPLLMAILDPERVGSSSPDAANPRQMIAKEVEGFFQVKEKTSRASSLLHAPAGQNPREWARQEYEEKVLDRIDEMIQRAQTDENYRTLDLLDAVLLLPLRPDLPYYFTGASTYDTPAKPGTESLRARLHGLLGDPRGSGAITNLSAEQTSSFFRTAREAHRKGHAPLLFELLDKARTVEDIQKIIHFLNSFQALAVEEGHRLLRYFFLQERGDVNFFPHFDDSAYQGEVLNGKRIWLDDLEHAHLLFYMAQRPSGLHERLTQLAGKEPPSDLIRLASPRLLKYLEETKEESIPVGIHEAVLGLEWNAAMPPFKANTAAERVLQLMTELGFLTGKNYIYDSYESGIAPLNFKGVEDTLEGISRDLSSLPEPLRTIGLERLRLEKAHPNWQVRYLFASTIDVLLRENVNPEDRATLSTEILGLLSDRSKPVQARALEVALSLARQMTSTEFTAFWGRLGFEKRLHELFTGKSVKGNLKALSIAERAWPLLTPSEKASFLQAVHDFIVRNSQKDISLSALYFLSNHSGDIPEGLKIALGSRPEFAQHLLTWLTQPTRESWTVRVREMARALIPFALQIASKENLVTMEKWAWKVLSKDSKSSPLAQKGALSLLAKLFSLTWAIHPDPSKRSKALKAVMSLLAEKNEGLRKGSVGVLMEMLKGSHPHEKEEVFRQIQGIIEDNDPSPFAILMGRSRKGAPRNTHEALHRQFYYLSAFVELAKPLPEWQNARSLSLFKNYLSPTLLSHLEKLSANLAPKQFPALFEILFQAFYTKDGQAYRSLILHLLEKTQTPGQFQQVAPFFRDFIALPQDVRKEFADFILEESKRTASGLPKDKKESKIFLDPPRAQSRLRRFLSDRFVGSLGGTKREKEALKNDLQKRIKLWEQDRLLAHLASLSGFSTPRGREAILGFVNDLISEQSVQASAALKNRRLANPRRYRSMEGFFSPEFIRRWGNEENDRLIPLGSLEAQGVLETDPLALRRAKYDFAALQIANHLKVPGASHLEGEALTAAIFEKIKLLPLDAMPENEAFLEMARELLDKMGKREEIFETEVEGLIQFIKDHPTMVPALGSQGQEILTDLQEMKRSLNADVLKGQAWLVITSNPADFIGSGRDPVTCQDPIRNTGFNKDGQPVSRAREGRFLYAKVVMAREAHLDDGTAVFSPESQVVGRSHLEVTTASGLPDPSSSPHLLAERAYVHPGFIYKRQFAEALNRFAQGLGLDPSYQVHIQFVNQGMLQYPRPLKDSRPIYRDTFH